MTADISKQLTAAIARPFVGPYSAVVAALPVCLQVHPQMSVCSTDSSGLEVHRSSRSIAFHGAFQAYQMSSQPPEKGNLYIHLHI